MKTLVFVLILIFAVIAAGCVEQQQLVGNDRDEHGCIGSAGYSWCEEKQKCLRVWEENCTSADCGDYSFSTCPEGCTQICAPSVCSADSKLCTTDCDGPGSCVAGEIN